MPRRGRVGPSSGTRYPVPCWLPLWTEGVQRDHTAEPPMSEGNEQQSGEVIAVVIELVAGSPSQPLT